MKIALFEVSSINHVCMIEAWAEICILNNWKLHIFTKKNYIVEMKEELLASEYIKVTSSDNVRELIKKLNQTTKSFDYLVLTTLQGHILDTLFIRGPRKKVIVVHNANTWLYPKWFLGSLKGLLKHLIRWLWMKRASLFLFNSSNMLEFAKRKLPNEKMSVVPFSLRRFNSGNVDEIQQRVIFPGMVSPKRKKYDIFFNMAEKFPSVEFVLLGRVNFEEGGQLVIDEIENRKLKNVIYFRDYVSTKKFQEEIQNADFLYSEIAVNFVNNEIVEKYGISKDSGISYLMLEYGIPAILNKDFHNIFELEDATLYFEDEIGLEKLIETCIKDSSKTNEFKIKISSIQKQYDAKYYANKMKLFLK